MVDVTDEMKFQVVVQSDGEALFYKTVGLVPVTFLVDICQSIVRVWVETEILGVLHLFVDEKRAADTRGAPRLAIGPPLHPTLPFIPDEDGSVGDQICPFKLGQPSGGLGDHPCPGSLEEDDGIPGSQNQAMI